MLGKQPHMGSSLRRWLLCPALRDASLSVSTIYFSSSLNEQKVISETGSIICSTMRQKICSMNTRDCTPKLPDLIFILPKIRHLSGNQAANVSLLNILGKVFSGWEYDLRGPTRLQLGKYYSICYYYHRTPVSDLIPLRTLFNPYFWILEQLLDISH